MNLWTGEEISRILLELDDRGLPFEKYTLRGPDGQAQILGRGGSANVYEAYTRRRKRSGYAMKVIGFFCQNADAELFDQAARVQEKIGDNTDQIVKTYDHTEIWVLFDERDRIVAVTKEKPEDPLKTALKLQFILMEKLHPVITRTKAGNIVTTPAALSDGEEREILKLAYDIGVALKMMHENRILHRDIKLENVFYCGRKKQYKLGDFGISISTPDGFASTVAFTKGYAAPEVRGTPDHDRYDHTADIYSFGMMLYVLANGLRFPDSQTYNANPGMQYSSGYMLPGPANPLIREEFYRVLAKACSYDPDDRYQSMEEMLIDIECLMFGRMAGYRREHKKAYLAAGSILLAIGVVMWKLTNSTGPSLLLSVREYLFLSGSIYKGITADRFPRKITYLCSAGMLVIGISLMISHGFSWPWLLLMLWMVFSTGLLPAFPAGVVLLVNGMSLLQRDIVPMLMYNDRYSWIAVAAVPMAYVLLLQFALETMNDRRLERFLRGGRPAWAAVLLAYTEILFLGLADSPRYWRILQRVTGYGITEWIRSVDLRAAGVAGLVFCLFWLVREHWMIRKEWKKRKV